jgi:hypothetical protein
MRAGERVLSLSHLSYPVHRTSLSEHGGEKVDKRAGRDDKIQKFSVKV